MKQNDSEKTTQGIQPYLKCKNSLDSQSRLHFIVIFHYNLVSVRSATQKREKFTWKTPKIALGKFEKAQKVPFVDRRR